MLFLVTGAAGFIGFHTTTALLAKGHTVVGLDNLNNYYAVSLKEARLAELEGRENFHFHRLELADKQALETIFREHSFDRVIHLAAQAGVRYSLENPGAYVDSNLTGFVNILECCRHYKTTHLVYASSSSVYGANKKQPFSETDTVDHPVSLYAATKKSNELMAHTYSHLFNLPTTGLRFFTVYGPWGRPDMAPMKFAKRICAGEPIDVYNYGEMRRDFTYIDDIVDGVLKASEAIPSPRADVTNTGISAAPYRVFNIGRGAPVALLDFIVELENALGRPAERNLMPMQDGDVPATWADISALKDATGFKPQTDLSDGVTQFVKWYRDYYCLG